jgi:S1-C subfamily serine protease
VRFGKEDILAASVVKTSVRLDLALLRVERRTRDYLEVRADKAPALGEQVFTIGFPQPDLMGFDPKFEEGSVSALSFVGDDTVLQSSVAVYPGNSGGALVRLDGSVAGVILSRWKDEVVIERTGTIASSNSFAVKSSFVAPFIGVDGRRRKKSTRAGAIASAERAACLVVVGVDSR